MRTFPLLILLACTTGLLTAFQHAGADRLPADIPQQTAQWYRHGLDQWQASIAQYRHAFEAWQNGDLDLVALQDAHRRTRLAYKRVEIFLDYFDPQGIKLYINGAPLPSVDRHAPEVFVLEPEGLQVLDELLFGPEDELEKDALALLIQALATNSANIVSYQRTLPFTHRAIMEAARLAAIRTFTLGLTGFDTPGSGEALREARVSTGSTLDILAPYLETTEGRKRQWLLRWQTIRSGAEAHFQPAPHFDDFDRLSFLTSVTNPLLELIAEMQGALGIEYAEETGRPTGPLNHRAGNLFSPDILHTAYYSRQVRDAEGGSRERLGRLLFYDPVLSADQRMACASCHRPEKAFTDGRERSLANDGYHQTRRNAPTLIHSVYSEHFFLDMREPVFERQIKHVVMDDLEFATDFIAIAEKLRQSPEYLHLFETAFPGQSAQPINPATISQALAAYVASLTAWNSPFDRFVRGELPSVDPAVRRGFNLFMGKAACGTCHFAPVFNGTVPPLYNDSESEVLGVPVRWDTLHPVLDDDPGRWASGRPHDEAPFYQRSFKTVTVRNAALTAPYMHHGGFGSLEDVMEFYNRGGGLGLGLEVPHQTLPDSPLGLDAQEKADIIAFMHSLTDTTGLTRRPLQLPEFPARPEWNSRTAQ